jgi:hypothetical protein
MCGGEFIFCYDPLVELTLENRLVKGRCSRAYIHIVKIIYKPREILRIEKNLIIYKKMTEIFFVRRRIAIILIVGCKI